MKSNFSIKYRLPLFFFFNVVFAFNSYSQSVGTLFMLQESFQGQMLNPAFTRNDNAIVISIPGLSGATLVNKANFKISDIVRKQPNGEMAIDLEHFYTVGKSTSRLSDMITIPLVYVGIPTENGRLNFYFKEQIGGSVQFHTEAIDFFVRGNTAQDLKSFNTDKAKVVFSGYKEVAGGYTFNLEGNTNIGIRGKILFGTVLLDIDDWEYGIQTSEEGDVVTITSEGTGRFATPFDTYYRNGKVSIPNTESFVGKYLTSIQNPGLAVDIGFTHILDNQSQISFSVNDLGLMRFSKNTAEIYQNESYDFTGFDFTNSLDYKEGPGFVNTYHLVLNTKEEIRDIFRPYADSTRYLKSLAPKTALHYQFDYSNKVSFGITNQTAFYKNNVFNTLSFSSLQKLGSLLLFQNINMHGLSQFTVGGGLQWETRFLQMVLATDNLLAVYHPASQNSFAVTAGISFLINRGKKKKESKGYFSPYRPFYEIKR